MKPVNFQYERPSTLKGALATMQDFAGFARPLAGGQSLTPMLHMRLIQPAVVVDLNDLSGELTGVRESHGGLKIGAMTRYSELEADPLVGEHLPALSHLIQYIGDRQVRNRGTIGGSICQADPTGEIPVCAVTMGATLTVESKSRGRREVPAAEFLLGAYTPALEPDELLISLEFPRSPARFRFYEIGRKHNDFAVLSILVAANRDETKRWGDVRIGLGGLNDRAVRADAVAQELEGEVWTDELIDVAIEEVWQVVDPPEDVRAGAEYRRHLLPIKLRSLLKELREDGSY